ncbi:ubiquilin-1, putative [Entamoeba invadens IP1]|uniref:Ubiquilin-1, putative n=1 Tax=Entamoeba invadens IP1 TaxID=370355 RepID=A0A0A1UCL1_ENTIV|nr:ubiquilin-1, putative [Entamoeba invadens IP1]ELP90029.1 ubiquilin-1, putative [Entamoeba invadens IP1]|eukprot:XP_004256800.1 ubiquilin-1, putative [Entamoeba invadens IP1]
MKINIRLTYCSQTMTVEFPDEEFVGMTVAGLKQKIQQQQQDLTDFKLIVTGKVLKDENIVSEAGVTNNSTIHLVRSKVPMAAPPVAAQQVPSQPQQTQPQQQQQQTFPQQPTQPQFPGMGGMGAMPGMGMGGMPNMAGMDPQQALQMMEENPQMMDQALDFMCQNPALTRSMLAMNPQTAALMNNPQLAPFIDQMLSNPQLLRSMMNPQNLQRAMQGGMPQMGGFPPPPMTSQPQQQFQQPQPTQPNPFGALFGTQPMNTQPMQPQAPQQVPQQMVPQQPVQQRTPQEIYANQINQLKEMGFYDETENIQVLQRTGGNVNAAVEILLSNYH